MKALPSCISREASAREGGGGGEGGGERRVKRTVGASSSLEQRGRWRKI